MTSPLCVLRVWKLHFSPSILRRSGFRVGATGRRRCWDDGVVWMNFEPPHVNKTWTNRDFGAERNIKDEMPERNVEIKINETSVSERVYRVKCKSMFASGIFREMIKNIFNHSVWVLQHQHVVAPRCKDSLITEFWSRCVGTDIFLNAAWL